MRQVLDDRIGGAGALAPRSRPVCLYLDAALAHVRSSAPGLSAMADLFATLAPHLHWQQRADADAARSPFREGHANTQIIGPNGLEHRDDLIVGVSLMAPMTAYPKHRHPSREVYFVLSEGQWWSDDQDWYTPGLGAIVYHPSGISHAMRASAAPLLALWCLWPDVAGG